MDILKKMYNGIKAGAKACMTAVEKGAKAVVAFVVGGVVAVKCAAPASASALFSITEAQGQDLQDTVTTNSALIYAVYIVIVGFAVVWALTRRLKGK